IGATWDFRWSRVDDRTIDVRTHLATHVAAVGAADGGGRGGLRLERLPPLERRATERDAAAGEYRCGRGTSFKGIVAELQRHGLSTASPWYWRLLAEQMHVAGRLHAGEYALAPGITPRQLLADMAAGKVLQRNFTIVDGWTFAELRQ